MNTRLRKIIKESFVNVMSIGVLVVFVSITNYTISINEFINQHSPIINTIHDDFSDNGIINNQYVTDNKLFIYDIKNKTKYELFQNNLNTQKFSPELLTQFKIHIKSNIDILIFSHTLLFTFDNIVIGISASHVLYFSIFLIFFIILITLIMNVSYHASLKNKNSKIENLTISTQEYVLSERTTSYLVRILHHKLNTPLKVLSTKSRILVETIVSQGNLSKDIKEKSELDYVQIDAALKTIFTITNKLKSYNELSQNETNIYKLCALSKETIDILKDDDFIIDIDYRTKLFDIDKNSISSHEIIQIFINQIKFSLAQLSDKISFKIFKTTNKSLTLFYSDNGNKIDGKLKMMLNSGINVSELSNIPLESAYFDLILNFNILNNTRDCNIKLLSSNTNGNLFEIKLPAIKHSFDKKKVD